MVTNIGCVQVYRRKKVSWKGTTEQVISVFCLDSSEKLKLLLTIAEFLADPSFRRYSELSTSITTILANK